MMAKTKTLAAFIAVAVLLGAPVAQAAFIVEMSEEKARKLGRIQDREAAESKNVSAQPSVPVWQVEVGKSLRETLTGWARQAGWEIHWDTKEDFVLLAPAQFTGRFEDSVTKLLAAVNLQGHAFRAEGYTGNRVLRIFQR